MTAIHPHRLLAALSSSAIGLAKRWLPEVGEPPGLFERLGAKTVVAATVRAIQLLGRQFVLGRDIAEALGEAAAQRREHTELRFSFDMLGEGARTERDALRHLASYATAIRAIVARQEDTRSDESPRAWAVPSLTTASRSSCRPCTRVTRTRSTGA